MSSFASMLARLHRGGHVRIHPNSLAAMPHLCPLVHARGLHSSHHTCDHREFHTFHSKRNGQFNLVQQTFCVPQTASATNSGTEWVGHCQRVKGAVGGAKKARAHIHAQACGWARW